MLIFERSPPRDVEHVTQAVMGILCWRIRLILACHNLPWFQR
jgi:hypothetical protein